MRSSCSSTSTFDGGDQSAQARLPRRIGAECAALDVPFFLEPLAYDDDLDEKGLEFAKKPEYVRAYMDHSPTNASASTC